MAKIIAWVVVIFAVLFVLRLLNLANSKKRRDGTKGGGRNVEPPADSMVRCARCGIFLPQAEARRLSDGYACPDANCASRR